MIGAEAHVGVGGEMENEIAAGHRAFERGEIEVVALDEFEARIFQRFDDERPLAGREIIPADDGLAVRKQAINETGADETGGAGDEDLVHEKRKRWLKRAEWGAARGSGR